LAVFPSYFCKGPLVITIPSATSLFLLPNSVFFFFFFFFCFLERLSCPRGLDGANVSLLRGACGLPSADHFPGIPFDTPFFVFHHPSPPLFPDRVRSDLCGHVFSVLVGPTASVLGSTCFSPLPAFPVWSCICRTPFISSLVPRHIFAVSRSLFAFLLLCFCFLPLDPSFSLLF